MTDGARFGMEVGKSLKSKEMWREMSKKLELRVSCLPRPL
jgi:hypothetical protein